MGIFFNYTTLCPENSEVMKKGLILFSLIKLVNFIQQAEKYGGKINTLRSSAK